MTEIKFVSGT